VTSSRRRHDVTGGAANDDVDGSDASDVASLAAMQLAGGPSSPVEYSCRAPGAAARRANGMRRSLVGAAAVATRS